MSELDQEADTTTEDKNQNQNTDTKESEKFWHIKPGSVPTDDPLLACLVVLTRYEHRPFSPEALSAGLPLVDNRLTPELFVRAAERADLSAQIVKRSLNEVSNLVLPAVALLNNRQACIIIALKKDKALIIQPETGDGRKVVKLDDLAKEYVGYCIFTKPTYKFDARATDDNKIDKDHWFFSVIKKVWPFYLEVAVAAILINLFALGAPLFTMNVYDRVVPNNAFETLMVLSVGVLVVYTFDFIMKMLRSYFIDLAGKKADVLLSSAIFEQMMGVKMEARPESVGAFASNISMFDSFRDFMTSATMSTIIDLPFAILFIVVIFLLGGNLFIVPAIAIPLVLLSGYLIQLPLNKIVQESAKYSQQKQALLIETLIGIESIKTVSAESPLQRKWESLTGLSGNYSIKVKLLSVLANNLSGFTQQVSGVALVILGVYNIMQGNITMGALIACNMLNGRALSPMASAAGLMTRYHQAISGYKSVDGLMQMAKEREPGKTPLYRPTLNGNIQFKDVSFTYPGQENPCLNSVSFNVAQGEKVGIIGRIGSGKTTIEKLLMGLYQPSSGSILFDNIEAQQLDPACIRKNIGYVPQDIILFFGSVKDNIVIGAPYADDSAVLRAASVSGCTEFVSQHPKGFDMEVGERGSKLSGGQRQSIAIARSMLLDPNILVLDEPTNMMDSRSEMMFKLKFQQVINNKTLILITHKGSLLSLVDRVIVVDGGKIVADGPKDTVLKALSEGKIKMASV